MHSGKYSSFPTSFSRVIIIYVDETYFKTWVGSAGRLLTQASLLAGILTDHNLLDIYFCESWNHLYMKRQFRHWRSDQDGDTCSKNIRKPQNLRACPPVVSTLFLLATLNKYCNHYVCSVHHKLYCSMLSNKCSLYLIILFCFCPVTFRKRILAIFTHWNSFAIPCSAAIWFVLMYSVNPLSSSVELIYISYINMYTYFIHECQSVFYGIQYFWKELVLKCFFTTSI